MGLYISLVDLNPTDKHSLGGWEEALGGVCERSRWLLVRSSTPTWDTFRAPSAFLASLGGSGYRIHLTPGAVKAGDPSRRAPTGRQPRGSEESFGVENGRGGQAGVYSTLGPEVTPQFSL